MIFFTDKPFPEKTNVQIKLDKNVVLFGQDPSDVSRKWEAEGKGVMQEAAKAGFHGVVSGYEGGYDPSVPTRYVPSGAMEILLFSEHADRLGKIEPYLA